MDWWSGQMNCPIDPEWRCDVCGWNGLGLTWGVVSGECRCNKCHTQYTMLDEKNDSTIRPINQLKHDYRNAAVWGWEKWEQPLSKWDDKKWDEALSAAKHQQPCFPNEESTVCAAYWDRMRRCGLWCDATGWTEKGMREVTER